MTPEKKLPCTAKLLLPSALLSEISLNTFPNGVQMSIFSSRFRLIVDLEVASGTWSSALSSPRTVESALWETYFLRPRSASSMINGTKARENTLRAGCERGCPASFGFEGSEHVILPTLCRFYRFYKESRL